MDTDANNVSGHRRDAAVTRSILDAAVKMAQESGFDSLSSEGVAARAGVGKTSIYRRWPNVWAVVTDAFLAEVNRLAPIQDRGTVRESFRVSMKSLAKAYRGRTGALMSGVVGRAQLDRELSEAIRVRWVEPRRQLARELVRRGVESSELRDDLDIDVVLDTLYGPIYHRLLVPHQNAAISDRFIDRVVDQVFDGLENPTHGAVTPLSAATRTPTET